MKKIRHVVYFRRYFTDFYDAQTHKVREKIDLGLYYLQYTQQIPGRYVGATSDSNLFYLRIKRSSDIYRIFFCYDHGNLVVLMNGFTKKTQKTPKSEITRAIKIKKEYFDGKD
ncbi:MAG: type II toxin-antitoxin system RelE/ParE family toxin [Saprospiraceae bacterium]|nr:type II toxin-antitoxin system RelE/ParE family toxin [Saprospiraceae bacterium]